MPRIPFVRETAALDAGAENSERLINLFAEKAPEGSRSPFLVRSLPGLTGSSPVGTGPIFAMNADLPGRVYYVSGTHLWRRTATELDDMGSVGAYTEDGIGRFVSIAVGPTLGMVCVPPNVFYFEVNQTTFTQAMSGGAPLQASSVAYLNGRFLFTDYASNSRFTSTNLFDPATSDPLSFAYADNITDVIRRVIVFQKQVYLIGYEGIQIWYDAGAANFPFASTQIVIPYGCAAVRSVAAGDGGLFWVGSTRIVYRSDRGAASRISTHAIEELFRQHAPDPQELTILSAFVHIHNGHTFYVLNMPDLTLAYDTTTGLWHQRGSNADGSGRYRINCAALSGAWTFGDATTGDVWSIDPNIGTDAGVAVQRIAILPPLWADTKRAFMVRCELEMQQGNSDLTLRWSDDDMGTWKGGRALSGSGTRAFTTRLGSFRKRIMRLSGTGIMMLLGMDADIAAGEW